MKILWLTNIKFSNQKIKSSGTWLQPLAEALACNENNDIFHICQYSRISSIKRENYRGIKQYLIPIKQSAIKRKIKLRQLPDNSTCLSVKKIVDEIKPDLIHVWGIESIWFPMKNIGIFDGYKVLLDVQGVMNPCYEFYYGGLSIKQIISTIGLREWLFPFTSLFYTRQKFYELSKIEKQIINSYEYISYQSEWTKNIIQSIQFKAKLYSTTCILRNEFYENKWVRTNHISPILFTSASSAVPYKGFHVLLKACSIIKKTYPDFILKVAGDFMNKKFGLRSGYANYLLKLIKKYNLTANIQFLGPITSVEMVSHQLESDICVIPSFVESYCLALAEAMMLGLPCVVSYAGAMPTIAKDGEEAIFYNTMDYTDCASKIIQVFKNKEFSEYISLNGRIRRLKDNNVDNVVQTQESIYKAIYEDAI